MSVQAYLRAAISDSTRSTYAAPIRLYEAFCAARGLPGLPVASAVVESWLVSVANAGGNTAASIRMYRSALSTYHEESSTGDAPNPLRSPRMDRIMKGIRRRRLKADAAAKAAKDEIFGITPAVIAELTSIAPRSLPRDAMIWAAVCIGTFGLLRISELIGSPRWPERTLRLDQVTFYRSAESSVVAAVPPVGQGTLPDHLVIDLGITKNKQFANGEPRQIAAAPAVSALWRWYHLRRDLRITDERVFVTPGGAPLALHALREYLQRHLATIGYEKPKVSGKSFRRGGASGLVAAGAPLGDVAAAGGWETLAIPLTHYSDKKSKATRAREVNRALAAAAPIKK